MIPHIDLKIRHQPSGITRKVVLPTDPAPNWDKLVTAAASRFSVDETRVALRYIDNDGDLVTLQAELDELWTEIQQGAKPRDSGSPASASGGSAGGRPYVRVDLIELPPASARSGESATATVKDEGKKVEPIEKEKADGGDGEGSDDEWVKPDSVDAIELAPISVAHDAEGEALTEPEKVEKGKERAQSEAAAEEEKLVKSMAELNTASASFASVGPSNSNTPVAAAQGTSTTFDDEERLDAEEARQIEEAIRLSKLEAEQAIGFFEESPEAVAEAVGEVPGGKETREDGEKETIFVNDAPTEDDDPTEEVASIAPKIDADADPSDVKLNDTPAAAGGTGLGVEADATSEDARRADPPTSDRPGLRSLLSHPFISSTPLASILNSFSSAVESHAGPDAGRSLDDLWTAFADISESARQAGVAVGGEVRELRRKTREAAEETMRAARESREEFGSAAGQRGFEAGQRFAGGSGLFDEAGATPPTSTHDTPALAQPRADTQEPITAAIEEENGSGTGPHRRGSGGRWGRRHYGRHYTSHSHAHHNESDTDREPQRAAPWCRRHRSSGHSAHSHSHSHRHHHHHHRHGRHSDPEVGKEKEASGEETETTIPGDFRGSSRHSHRSSVRGGQHGHRAEEPTATPFFAHQQHMALLNVDNVGEAWVQQADGTWLEGEGEGGEVMPGGLQQEANGEREKVDAEGLEVHPECPVHGEQEYRLDQFNPEANYGFQIQPPVAHEALGTATPPMQYGVPGGFDNLVRRGSDPVEVVPQVRPEYEGYAVEVEQGCGGTGGNYDGDQGVYVPGVGWGHAGRGVGVVPRENWSPAAQADQRHYIEARRQQIQAELESRRERARLEAEQERLRHSAERQRWQDELDGIRSEHQAMREAYEEMRAQAEQRAMEAQSESRALSMQVQELLERDRERERQRGAFGGAGGSGWGGAAGQRWGERPFRRGPW